MEGVFDEVCVRVSYTHLETMIKPIVFPVCPQAMDAMLDHVELTYEVSLTLDGIMDKVEGGEWRSSCAIVCLVPVFLLAWRRPLHVLRCLSRIFRKPIRVLGFRMVNVRGKTFLPVELFFAGFVGSVEPNNKKMWPVDIPPNPPSDNLCHSRNNMHYWPGHL